MQACFTHHTFDFSQKFFTDCSTYKRHINNFNAFLLNQLSNSKIMCDNDSMKLSLAPIFAALVVASLIWNVSPPGGLDPAAWHMFSIFVGTIFSLDAVPIVLLR
jgi:hypothetical protein